MLSVCLLSPQPSLMAVFYNLINRRQLCKQSFLISSFRFWVSHENLNVFLKM